MANSPVLSTVQVKDYTRESGIEVLGVPIAHPESAGEFDHEVWQERISKMAKTREALKDLRQPHVHYTILR